jgi:monoamine oxidase
MSKKATRSPLLFSLRRAIGLAIAAEQSGKTTDDFLKTDLSTSPMQRRRFIKNAGSALLFASMSSPVQPWRSRADQDQAFGQAPVPRIAIIGGGMAGLNALHHLKKNGIDATVYESSGRTSGRIFTVQEAMGSDTWAEFGAEFIDTLHADMWALAKEFDIELIDYAQASEAKLKAEAFYFEGKHRSLKKVVKEFRKFAGRLKADIDRLPEEINYLTTDAFTIEADNMHLSDYLTKIGAKGWPKRLIEVAYESEYGLAPDQQSAINLLYLISPDTKSGKVDWFGESDERYKARGGNMRIPESIAKKYPVNIKLNHALEAIKKSGNGGYQLSFKGGSAPIIADYVLLAIPFTVLRKMDLSGLDFPADKLRCINELGYGTNSKLMLGMKSHFWRKKRFGGLVYADNGIPNGWDNAQLQTPDKGPAGLSILFGGAQGVNVGEGSPESQKDIYLPKWEQIYPGATAQFNGKIARMHWPSYPHALGSYVCPRPGQYTSIIGLEATPVGQIYFAGEHCGGEFSGFMNGAAKSGREAAEAMVEALVKARKE